MSRLLNRCLCLVALLSPVGAVTTSDLAEIRKNITNYFVGVVNNSAARNAQLEIDAISSLKDMAASAASRIQPSGACDDLSLTQYQERPTGTFSPSKHYDRLLQLALCLRTPGTGESQNATYQTDLENGLTYIYNHHKASLIPQSGYLNVCQNNTVSGNQKENPWWWVIGIPYYYLGPILILTEGTISPTAWNMGFEIFTNLAFNPPYHPNFDTGDNQAWSTLVHLYKAVLMRNPNSTLAKTYAKQAQDNFWAVCQIVSGNGSAQVGLKPDQSFWQHSQQFYNGGYGATFADTLSQYLVYSQNLSDADGRLDQASKNNFVTYMENGISFLIQNNYFTPSASGREITRKSENARDGLYSLIRVATLSDPEISSQKKSAFADRVRKIDATFKSSAPGGIGYGGDIKVVSLLDAILAGGTSQAEPTGHRYYPSSDFTFHRAANWSVSVKAYSDRVTPFECVNNEGLKSWHISDGMTLVHLSGDEYVQKAASVMPCLDWDRLPGITVERRPYGNVPNGLWGSSGGSKVVGGVSSSSFPFGVSMMRFQQGSTVNPNQPNLTFKKSWFFFDDEVVCLGSDIKKAAASTYSVESVVNQWPLSTANSPLTVNGQDYPGNASIANATWAHADEIGYYFPTAGTTLQTLRESRSGDWSQVNGSQSGTVSGTPFLTLFFDHGTSTASSKYAYALVPKKSATEIQSYATSSPFSVLKQDGNVHAIRDKSSGATGYAFWNASTCDEVTVDLPCALLTRRNGNQITFLFSEPQQVVNGVLHITYARKLQNLVLPAGVSADTSAPNTTVFSVQVNNTLWGKTFEWRGDDFVAPTPTVQASLVSPGNYQITLGVDEESGYYKLNGGAAISFSRSGAVLAISGPTTLEVWGKDDCGNESAHLQSGYNLDTTAPRIAFPTAPIYSTPGNTLTLTADEASGYFSTNNDPFQIFPAASGKEVSFTLNDSLTIRAYGLDAANNLSPVITNTYLVHPGAFVEFEGRVAIEAEHPALLVDGTGAYAGKSWMIQNDAGASGGKSLLTAELSLDNYSTTPASIANGPRADYAIDFIHPGDYWVWMRVKGASTSGDSVHFGLDGVVLENAAGGFNGQVTGTPYFKKTLGNGVAAKITVSAAGLHTFHLWLREDGAQVDKIYLTQDASDDPNQQNGGLGSPETPRMNAGPDQTPPVITFSTPKTVFSQPFNLTLLVNEREGFYSWSESGPFQPIDPVAGTALTIDADHLSLYTFTRDLSGNKSAVAVRTFIQDTSAPALVGSIPAAATYDDGFSIPLSMSEPGTLWISEDGGAHFTSFPSPSTVSVTKNVRLAVYAEDLAGNKSPVESRTYHLLHQGAYDSPYTADASESFSIEAEHYTFSSKGLTATRPEWKMHFPTGAGVRGLAMQAGLPEGNDSVTTVPQNIALAPRMDYKVMLPSSGTYHVWVKFAGLTSADDSLHVGFQGAPLGTTGMALMTSSLGGDYFWRSNQAGTTVRMSFTASSAGEAVINLWMREDGVSVDRLFITKDVSIALTASIEATAESPRANVSQLAQQGMAAKNLLSANSQNDGPKILGIPNNFTTNKPFSIEMTPVNGTGYWSTNGIFNPFSSNLTIWISNTSTLQTFSVSAPGDVTQTNARIYDFDLQAPLVAIKEEVSGGRRLVTLRSDEDHGYWSTNGSAFFKMKDRTEVVDLSRGGKLVAFGRDALGNTSAEEERSYLPVEFTAGPEKNLVSLNESGLLFSLNGARGKSDTLLIMTPSGSLVQNHRIEGSEPRWIWDFRDLTGKKSAPGTYFYRLRLDTIEKSGTFILAR